MLHDNWERTIFPRFVVSEYSETELVPGIRLGINYVRSLEENVAISISAKPQMPKLNITQSSIGPLAISSVIWDCGLFLCDFLVHIAQNNNVCCNLNAKNIVKLSLQQAEDNEAEFQLSSVSIKIVGGRVLDLGCGTGVCGIVAAALGASEVKFSDSVVDLARDNAAANSEFFASSNICFEEGEWGSLSSGAVEAVEVEVEVEVEVDVVLCSDLIYEAEGHPPLLALLRAYARRSPQAVLVFAYKKRSEERERDFFLALSSSFRLLLLDPSPPTIPPAPSNTPLHPSTAPLLPQPMPLLNLPAASLADLFIIVATPFELV